MSNLECIDLLDLLPAVTEAILESGRCTCHDASCTVCRAARALDELHREMAG